MPMGASEKANCGVDAIRKSLEPTEPPGVSFLNVLRVDDHRAAGQYIEFSVKGFLVAFTEILDDNHIGNSQEGSVEGCLADPMADFDGAIIFLYANLGNVEIKLMARRLSLLFNTIWKVCWLFKLMTGGKMMTAFSSAVEPLDEMIYILINITSGLYNRLNLFMRQTYRCWWCTLFLRGSCSSLQSHRS